MARISLHKRIAVSLGIPSEKASPLDDMRFPGLTNCLLRIYLLLREGLRDGTQAIAPQKEVGSRRRTKAEALATRVVILVACIWG